MTAASAERTIAGACIADGAGRLLLLQRSPEEFLGGHWELPSGHVEEGEAFGVALAREIREETGLQLVRCGAYVSSFSYMSGSGVTTTQHTYVVACAPGSVCLSSEHQDYRWVAAREPLLQPMSAETQGQIEQFFRMKPELHFQHGAGNHEGRSGPR